MARNRKRVQITLDQEFWDQLQELAEDNRVTVGTYLEQTINLAEALKEEIQAGKTVVLKDPATGTEQGLLYTNFPRR